MPGTGTFGSGLYRGYDKGSYGCSHVHHAWPDRDVSRARAAAAIWSSRVSRTRAWNSYATSRSGLERVHEEPNSFLVQCSAHPDVHIVTERYRQEVFVVDTFMFPAKEMALLIARAT